MTMRQEGWPLLAAIAPIAILATWCCQRLAFVPPRAGETVAVHACFPVSAVGELAHVVPQAGLREVSREVGDSEGQWIQEIANDVPDPDGIVNNGIATWKLQAEARPEPYTLQIRCKTVTVNKELRVGQPVYAPDVELYGPDQPILSVQVDMRPVEFLGLVPGIEMKHVKFLRLIPGINELVLPPWLVAYFLIAIPAVSLIKRLTGIH